VKIYDQRDIINRSYLTEHGMKSLIFPVVVLLTLAGCSFAPVSELRNLQPTRTALFSVDYEDLGSCVIEGWQIGESDGGTLGPGNLVYEIIIRRTKGIMYVTSRAPGRDFVLLDTTFSKTGNGQTTVDMRQGLVNGGPARGPRLIAEKSWPTIEKCAKELTN
jgi:hypothetical protein